MSGLIKSTAMRPFPPLIVGEEVVDFPYSICQTHMPQILLVRYARRRISIPSIKEYGLIGVGFVIALIQIVLNVKQID
jgi:hypothetical protein